MQSPVLLFLVLVSAHLTSAALPSGLPRAGSANAHSGTAFIHSRLRTLRALSEALTNSTNEAATKNEAAVMEDDAMQSGDVDPTMEANVADVFESSGDAGDDVLVQSEQVDNKKNGTDTDTASEDAATDVEDVAEADAGDVEEQERPDEPEATDANEESTKDPTEETAAENEDAQVSETPDVSQTAKVNNNENNGEEGNKNEGQNVLGSSEAMGRDEDDNGEVSVEIDPPQPTSTTPESFIESLTRPTRLPPIVHPMFNNPSVLQGAVLPRKSHNRRAVGSPFDSPSVFRYNAPGRFVGSFFDFPEGRKGPHDGPLNDQASQFQEHVAKLRESLAAFSSSDGRSSRGPSNQGRLDLPLSQRSAGQFKDLNLGPRQSFGSNQPRRPTNTRFLDLMDSLQSKFPVKNNQERRLTPQRSGYSGLTGGQGGFSDFNGLPGRQSEQTRNGRSALQSAMIQNTFEHLRKLG